MRGSGRVTALLLVVVALGFGAWRTAGGERGGAEVAVLEQSDRGTTFEILVPGVEVTPVALDGREFSELSLPGQVMAVFEEGRPQVPKVPVLLGIPTGSRASVRVLERETRTLKVAGVSPLQAPLLEGETPKALEYDAEFYGRDESYPGVDVRVVETGTWRDVDVANVQVYPVQVNAGRGEIEVATRLVVRVDYDGGRGYPRTVSEWVLPHYAEYLDNFAELGIRPETDYTPGARYLVVMHDSYAANSYLVDSLLGWVEQRGYEVRTISKSSYTAAEIRDSVKAEYDRSTPHLLRWVLLVGEHSEIPTGSYSGVGKSDFYYCDLEPFPTGDNYPEVCIARLSPESQTDLDNQIKKILKYQKDPPATNDWLTKLRMAAHREQYPAKYSGCIRGIYHMPKPYYDYDTDTLMGQYVGNAEVTADINNGTGILIYRGHGSETAWTGWCGSNFGIAEVNALANGDLTSVSYQFCCLSGDISLGTCLIEAWMRKYPGGTASALSATQASYTYPNHGQCSTTVRATADTWTITVPGVRDYAAPIFDVSGVMYYMDAYLAKYWPESPYYYNIWMYLTLGDPSMPVWTGGMPQMADVTYPAAIPLGPYDLGVTVTVGGEPVEDALVCAWKDTEFYVVERTDASGVATLPVNAVTPGAAMVTVTEGHAQHSVGGATHAPILPFEGTVLTRSGTGYVIYLSHAINDSAGGNGDGIINPEETFRIPMCVKNYGDSAAHSVVGRLLTHDAGATITDSLVDFGEVPGGDSVLNPEGFEMTVGSGLPNEYAIPCTLFCRDVNDSVWVSAVTFYVGAPIMSYGGTIVKDQNSTNPNRKVDPGETAELEIVIANSGLGNGYNVTGVLKSGDARFQVLDSHAVYGVVPADSFAVNVADHFEVVADSSIPVETPIPCTLSIYGDGGYVGHEAFDIVISEVLLIDPLPDGPRTPAVYWAYDGGDTGYTSTPEFEWIEVSGLGTRLDLARNETRQVGWPSSVLGPFVYYNQPFAQLSICSNGFIMPGRQEYNEHANMRLPDTSAPALIAVNWDDLDPTSGGGVWYYLDSVNQRFIIEWDSVHYYSSTDEWDKFEIVIYPASTGAGCDFVCQYATATRLTSSTVGLQDLSGRAGIQCLFNNDYDRKTFPIIEGSAIRFTGASPAGVVESNGRSAASPMNGALEVFPNPFGRTAGLRWQVPLPGAVRLTVFDVTGRAVRTLVAQDMPAGTHSATWDGRDATGRLLASGTYIYKLEMASGVSTAKAVKTR